MRLSPRPTIVMLIAVLTLASSALAQWQDPNKLITVEEGGVAWEGVGNGPAFGITEARVLGTGQTDAYDVAAVLVTGFPYVASSPSLLTTERSGTVYSGGDKKVAGLMTRLQYFFSAQRPVVRVIATFTNPSHATVAQTISWYNDLGSDSETQIIATSNGDTRFTRADRWLITDDADPVGGDPRLLFVLFGTGNPTVKPSDVLNPAFGQVIVGYPLIVAPKQSVSLMWFNGVMPRPDDALAEVCRLDSLWGDDPLLADLSEEELARIVNWDLGDHGTHSPPAARQEPCH